MVEKFIVTTGKKKSSTARVSIGPGTGVIRINSIPLEKWGTYVERSLVKAPLTIMDEARQKYDIDVNVVGGGTIGQASASRVGIARGLMELTKDEKLRAVLLEYDDKILSGDSRQREPYKPGDSSPRSRRQKSYR